MLHPGPTRLRELTATFTLYLAGGLAQQAVGFFLLPVYISRLSPAEYGTMEILNTTGLIMLTLLTLGLSSAVVKCYHQDCRTEAQRKGVMATSLIMGAPLLAVGCGILLVRAEWIAGWLLGGGDKRLLVMLTAIWIFLTGVSGIVLALFRTREEARVLTALGLSSFVLLLCLNIGFVYFLRWGVAGILWGNVLSTAFGLVVAAPFLRQRVRFALQPELVRPLLAFGLFVVPAAIAGWIMNVSDRYILAYYDQLGTVGVYSLGYKFGSVLEAVIVSPFQVAWAPFAFRISRQADHRRTYATTLTYLMAACVFVIVALTHLSYPLLHLVGRPEYRPALRIIPVVALAYLFNGVHYCVSPGIHIEGKSKFLPMLVIGAAALNVVLNVLWIPSFGMMGAAWSTAIAFGLLALATLLVSNAFHPVRYEYGRLAKIGTAGALAYLLGQVAHSGSILMMLAIATAAVLSFPILLVMFGFLEASEKTLVGATVIKRLPGWAAGGLAPSLPRE